MELEGDGKNRNTELERLGNKFGKGNIKAGLNSYMAAIGATVVTPGVVDGYLQK